jgi:alpha,alpha-trehalose phosphorylase
MKPKLEGVIFDLDGVITDTAEYHYQAWKALADELGIPFDREFNQNLRGVGRVDSLKLILGQADHSYSEDEIIELAGQKNEHYKKLIEQITPDDLLPGIEQLLTDLREAGVKLAVASASRNAPTVIDGLKIGGMFDFIADAAKIVVGKPDPEIFLTSAEKLAVPVRNCVGVEDAEAGITAIREAGMFSVGIGDYLENPDWKLPSTEELTYERLKERFRAYWDET